MQTETIGMAGAAVRLEDGTLIPADVGELESFRRWTRSPDFPGRGRIDFLEGTIELEMSPEELQSHGALKAKLFSYVHNLVEEKDLGQVFCDRARLVSGAAGLSCEPDVLLVTWESLASGQVRYLAPNPDSRRQVEVEGSPALVVEVVSDSSVGKDTKRLPGLYARAGVAELWLADARSTLSFQIYQLAGTEYRSAPLNSDGFQWSHALTRWVRLRREAGRFRDTWRYLVDQSPS